MKLVTWSVVLLALLLAAMAMVPMVSAVEIPAVVQPNIQPLIFGQTPDKDIFTYLGIEKPVPSVGPKWQTYDSSKKEVDDKSKTTSKNLHSHLVGSRLSLCVSICFTFPRRDYLGYE